MLHWESTNNNEPYWEVFAGADVRVMMVAAGFGDDAAEEALVAKHDGPGSWFAVLAMK